MRNKEVDKVLERNAQLFQNLGILFTALASALLIVAANAHRL